MRDTTFAESYGRATLSGDLSHSDRRISDPDRLMALALTDRRLVSEMFRSKVSNDAAAIRNLIAMWRADVVAMARRGHWTVKMPVNIDQVHIEVLPVYLPVLYCWSVADASLNFWLFDVCQACQGRKFQLIDGPDGGKRSLSDKICPSCNGDGHVKPSVHPAILDGFLKQAIDALEGRFQSAQRRANRKL